MKALNKIKNWLSVLSGKPRVQVEDYVLEHLLAYHGLVESGADEQPQFTELAAAVKSAVAQASTVQLDTALKVPPLWWGEHLQPVFEELVRHEPEKLEAVLGRPDQSTGDLLSAEDWRVRANAANVLAALCKQHRDNEKYVTFVEQRLTEALKECAQDQFKAAFLHISYALGTLCTQTARKILLDYLHDPEPWFRVDATRALTLFPAEKVSNALLTGLLDHHVLLDYAAMVTARAYVMPELLRLVQGAEAEEGLCELTLGVLQAAKQTAFAQAVEETKVSGALPQLLKPDPIQCSARHIRTVLQLAQYLAAHNELEHHDLEPIVQFRHKLTSAEFSKSMKKRLSEVAATPAKAKDKTGQDRLLQDSDIRHTILLIAELHLGQFVPQLLGLLNPDFIALDEVIIVLGQLGDAEAAEALVRIAEQLVNLKERSEKPLSAQPVTESNPSAAKSYWLVLTALSRLPHDSSFKFLCRAAADFAPDKRAQATRSLIQVCSAFKHHHPASTPGKPAWTLDLSQLRLLLQRALKDPSSEVKKAALQGVAELGMSELLPYVRKCCAAKERSLSEEAFTVFEQLYRQGAALAVLLELRQGANWTLNSNLRQRYARLAAALIG